MVWFLGGVALLETTFLADFARRAGLYNGLFGTAGAVATLRSPTNKRYLLLCLWGRLSQAATTAERVDARTPRFGAQPPRTTETGHPVPVAVVVTNPSQAQTASLQVSVRTRKEDGNVSEKN